MRAKRMTANRQGLLAFSVITSEISREKLKTPADRL